MSFSRKLMYICIGLLSSIGIYTHMINTAQAQNVLQDKEYIKAVGWMFDHGLTKYDNAAQYRPHDVVLREHAAKFLSQYSSNIEFKVLDMSRYCEFKDLDQADASLKNSILQSCLLNIFYGSNGMFYPTRQLTKAEALVTIVRVLEGKQAEPDEALRWKNYTVRAKQLGLSKETDAASQDRPITRYEMALLLYRASQQ